MGHLHIVLYSIPMILFDKDLNITSLFDLFSIRLVLGIRCDGLWPFSTPGAGVMDMHP